MRSKVAGEPMKRQGDGMQCDVGKRLWWIGFHRVLVLGVSTMLCLWFSGIALAGGLGHGKGEYCEGSGDCIQGLICLLDCPEEATGCDFLTENTCVTPRELYCEYTDGCGSSGRCVWDGKECRVGSDLDCRKSEFCGSLGHCSVGKDAWGERECRVTSNSDCARGEYCQTRGECTAKNGECVVSVEAECRRSSECRHEGACFLEKRRMFCVSREDLEGYRAGDRFCKKTRGCKAQGRCSVVEPDVTPQESDLPESQSDEEGWDPEVDDPFLGDPDVGAQGCGIETDGDCQKRLMCLLKGWCAVGGEEGCRSLDASHCKMSAACKEEGACGFDPDRDACFPASAAHCKKSKRCKEQGLCGFDAEEGRCSALKDAHCKRSTVCRKGKRCQALSGVCHASCSDRPECALEGRCTGQQAVVEGEAGDRSVLQCVGGRDRDCRKSSVCVLQGRCAWSADAERCVAISVVDCKASLECACQGRCDLDGEECDSSASLDGEPEPSRVKNCRKMCQTSAGCADEGLCHFDFDRGVCIAKTPKDCVGPCRKSGACVLANAVVGCVACGADGENPCLGTAECRYKGACVHVPSQARCVTEIRTKKKRKLSLSFSFGNDPREERPSCESLMGGSESTRVLLTGLADGREGEQTPYVVAEHRVVFRSTTPPDLDSTLSTISVYPCWQASDGSCGRDREVNEGWFFGRDGLLNNWDCSPDYEGPTLGMGMEGDRNKVCRALSRYVKKACYKNMGVSFSEGWCERKPPKGTFDKPVSESSPKAKPNRGSDSFVF
jgi:hypothetical protein